MSYFRICKALIFLIMLSLYGLCHGAVILEPVDQNADFYQTRYLFLDNTMPKAPKPVILEEQSTQAPENTRIEQQVIVSEPIITQNTSSGSVIIQAYYEAATTENVDDIISKYKSIPGGITLEGYAGGLMSIKTINFDPSNNEFLINQAIRYKNPLSVHDMRQVFLAIDKQDLMGVSLGENDIIYGALHEGETPTIFLKLADHFLGSIVFAQSRWVAMHTFPKGYRPKAHTSSGGLYAVYFNFSDYQFRVAENIISCTNSTLRATLIPLTEEQTSNGGYLPDYTKIKNGQIPSEYVNNITHVVENIDAYQNEARLKKTHQYGEAAAFARTLQQNHLSLSKLAQELQ
ncbi:MAG: hypothetical protein Q8Q33_10360 [Chlamydiota bacterium]|nr:hypothetical protein [Chlamydiota bacterium]